ncbi:MAG: insulinase family protein [candidate division NC10 bacterium]|nr:insulinase family protein [candidate division NC10 bacterium]
MSGWTANREILRRVIAAFALLLLLLPAAARASAAPATLPFPVTEHRLKNGMRFLIVERRESPTFSAYLRFKVGSVNDSPGQTGLAHLLEHMMFKGTALFGSSDPEAERPLLERIDALQAQLQAERAKTRRNANVPDAAKIAALEKEIAASQAEANRFIVRNELWEIYRRNGGTRLNASTSRDGTQYYISLPRNRLELWALLESDRIRNPVFREFYTERDVVQEERRERVDTSPRGQLWEAALATAFVAVPYRQPTLGWPGDLANLTRPQAEAYFRTFYAPNNALAVLVGDLDPAEVIRIAERYFGAIPSQPVPTEPLLQEPPQGGERRVRVEFPAEPHLLMLYQGPAAGHPDTYPLWVLGSLLGDGRSSRLYTRLVEERRLVTSIAVGPWFLRHAGLVVVQATPRAPHTLEEVEAALSEELERSASEGPSARELEKVRNQIEMEAVSSLASNGGLAARLGDAWAILGDWRLALEELRRIQAVTAEDVLAVAKKYLTPQHRTVASLVRGGKRPASASPGQAGPARQVWESQ